MREKSELKITSKWNTRATRSRTFLKFTRTKINSVLVSQSENFVQFFILRLFSFYFRVFTQMIMNKKFFFLLFLAINFDLNCKNFQFSMTFFAFGLENNEKSWLKIKTIKNRIRKKYNFFGFVLPCIHAKPWQDKCVSTFIYCNKFVNCKFIETNWF